MHAEIIAIGDEIVSGQTLDTNSQWLSQRLEELGIRVLYHTAAGDELAPCRDVFRQAIARAEIVIATGGLGPTADDLTRQALAEAVGRELVVFPEALEHIRARFARRNWSMPPQNEVQALFPAGSRMIPNPNGTAPGIDLEISRLNLTPCRFFVLPGVPAEMREMWPSVAEAIRALGGGGRVIVRRKINCFGAGESKVEAMLPDLIRRGRQPTVGITASKTSISLRIVADGETEAECEAAIHPVAGTIYRCLGDLVYGEGDEELQHSVVRLLREKKRTLATVEFGTGGMIAELFGAVPGSDVCYRGGLVAADLNVARNLLDIPVGGQTFLSEHRETDRNVCPTKATDRNVCPPGELTDLAEAARAKFRTDCVLAVGPFPEHRPENPLPVDLAFDLAGDTFSQSVPFVGHPDWLTIYIVKRALNLVRLKLLENS